MKKLLLSSVAAALVFAPFGHNKAFGLEENEWSGGLTESVSFYRVTKGFVSPLSELDNQLDTKIEFTRLNQLSYFDYIFVKSVYVEEIRFNTDTPQYQRIALMKSGNIVYQFDVSKYPDGVIKLPAAQVVDRIKYQFNGSEGTVHNLSEFEIKGYVHTSPGGTVPTGEKIFVTPQMILDLIESSSTSETGDGEPTPVEVPVIPEVEESPGSDSEGEPPVVVEEPVLPESDPNTYTGDGTPISSEIPPEVETGEPGIGSGDVLIEQPAPEEEASDTIGDSQFIDNNNDGIEDPIVPEVVEVVPVEPETPIIEENVEPIIIVPPVEEEPVVVEEPIIEEVPVSGPVIVDVPEVESTNPSETYIDKYKFKSKPLTPSIFHNKHNYVSYRLVAASDKLESHKHYDESVLKSKLEHSIVVIGKELSTIFKSNKKDK
jgi:hypothetical protein